MHDGKKVFVTVGTTSFDELITTISQHSVIEILRKRGYTELIMQIGKISLQSDELPRFNDFSISFFNYKSSITENIRDADLVISHAGAGTCLETLAEEKPLVVVVNEGLMNNHQMELANRLHLDKHAFCCTCRSLPELLESMDVTQLRPMDKGDPNRFTSYLDKIMALYP